MSAKKFTATKMELIELYKEYSGKEIADMYDCSSAAVYRRMRQWGIPRRDNFEAHPGLEPITKTELEALYKDNTTREIAELKGVSAEWVRKLLIRYKINRRSVGGRRTFEITKERLTTLYQNYTIQEIADMFGVGQTVVHKRIHQLGVTLDGFPEGGHRAKTGKKFTLEHREAMAQARYGNRVGADNHKWEGGITPENAKKRASAIARHWKQRALRRTDNKCEVCGIEKGHICKCCGQKTQMHVHHIKPFKDNEDLRFSDSNAEVLCAACHHAKHFKQTE